MFESCRGSRAGRGVRVWNFCRSGIWDELAFFFYVISQITITWMGLDCGTMGYKKIFDAEVAAGSATCGAVTVKTLN